MGIFHVKRLFMFCTICKLIKCFNDVLRIFLSNPSKSHQFYFAACNFHSEISTALLLRQTCIVLFHSFRGTLQTRILLFRILFVFGDQICILLFRSKVSKQNVLLEFSLFVFKLVKQEARPILLYEKKHSRECLIQSGKYHFAQQLPPLRYERLPYCQKLQQNIYTIYLLIILGF